MGPVQVPTRQRDGRLQIKSDRRRPFYDHLLTLSIHWGNVWIYWRTICIFSWAHWHPIKKDFLFQISTGRGVTP